MNKDNVLNVINKLPSNLEVCNSILKKLNNNSTKIIEMSAIKGNYYSFINDTIYISNVSKNASDENRVIVIAHECIHSIQNKVVQLANTVISNLYLMLLLVTIILLFFKIDIIFILFPVMLLNIVVREYLELNAVTKSKDVFLDYIKEYLSEEEIFNLDEYFSKEINKAKYLYFLKIIFDKLWPFLTVMIINYICFNIIY